MDAFDALADGTRRRMLLELAITPRTAGQLADAEPTSRPGISRHLRVLRESGLVDVTATGRNRVYSLAPHGLTPVRELLQRLTGPPIPEQRLAALELEVRRTSRERRDATEQEESA